MYIYIYIYDIYNYLYVGIGVYHRFRDVEEARDELKVSVRACVPAREEGLSVARACRLALRAAGIDMRPESVQTREANRPEGSPARVQVCWRW